MFCDNHCAIADYGGVVAGNIAGGGVIENLCPVRAESFCRPFDGCDSGVSTCIPFAGVFGSENGWRVEAFEASQHFTVEVVGGLLIVEMGKVGGGDEDGVSGLKDCGKRLAELMGNSFFLVPDHEREEFEIMRENAL